MMKQHFLLAEHRVANLVRTGNLHVAVGLHSATGRWLAMGQENLMPLCIGVKQVQIPLRVDLVSTYSDSQRFHHESARLLLRLHRSCCAKHAGSASMHTTGPQRFHHGPDSQLSNHGPSLPHGRVHGVLRGRPGPCP